MVEAKIAVEALRLSLDPGAPGGGKTARSSKLDKFRVLANRSL